MSYINKPPRARRRPLQGLSRAQRERILRKASKLTWKDCKLTVPCYGVPFPDHPTNEQLDTLEGSLSWVLEHEMGF